MFLTGLVGLLALGLVFLVAAGVYEIQDRMRGEDQWIAGTVESKEYEPSRTSTGVGPVIGGNGGMTVTTHTTSEEWTILVDIPGWDELQKFSASGKTYKKAKPGMPCRLCFTRGASGKLYGPTAIEI